MFCAVQIHTGRHTLSVAEAGRRRGITVEVVISGGLTGKTAHIREPQTHNHCFNLLLTSGLTLSEK